MMRRILLAVLLWASAGASAWACPVCFRMEEGPVSAGVRAAIVVLMTVTVSVLSGFAIFIRGFVRRARTAENLGTSEPRDL